MKSVMQGAAHIDFENAKHENNAAVTSQHTHGHHKSATHALPAVNAATMAGTALGKRALRADYYEAEKQFDSELLSRANRQLKEFKQEVDSSPHPKKSLLAAHTEESEGARAERYFEKFGMKKMKELLDIKQTSAKVESTKTRKLSTGVDAYHSRWEAVDA